jgi:tetratricopeptide (TPR) repeat protein
MANRNGDRFWVSRLPNCIGFIHNELQDFEGAVRYNLKGVDVARRDQVLEAESNSLINLGSTYLQTGNQTETPPAFKTVEENFARDAWFRWRYNIRLQAGKTQYWLSQGNLDQAETYANKLMDIAKRFDAGKYIAVAHNLRAEIAVARSDLSTAEQELNSSLDVLRARPVEIVLWKTYAELGRLHAKRGDTPACREAFVRSSEIVHRIAANVADQELRQKFLNSVAVQEVIAGASQIRKTST